MHPIVPVIMALGAILFIVGIIVFAWLGRKKTKTVSFLGKNYRFWRFVLFTIGLGITLIMLSIMIKKHVPYQPEQDTKPAPIAISGNIKYELESVLSSLYMDIDAMMPAINRFQAEYQEALQRGDRNTMDLLTLEMAYHIKAELKKQDHPEHQIEREAERIIAILKQPYETKNNK